MVVPKHYRDDIDDTLFINNTCYCQKLGAAVVAAPVKCGETCNI